MIGAEIMSRIVDWKDRSTCVLFGDGAGAVIMKSTAHCNEMTENSAKLHRQKHEHT